MTPSLVLAQLLNGIQFGVLLFLLSAGLTLVLGIMRFMNLMHGSLYMIGAYLGASTMNASGSFALAGLAAVLGTVLVGYLVERVVFFRLYPREHLDQVLATFGLILFFNELVIMLWGPSALSMDVPAGLRHTVQLFGFAYPAYRFAIIGVGLAVGVGLYVLIHRTAVGIRIRAAASNSAMASALGINVKRLNTQVVCLGAGLAALAGLMAGPITAVQSGMGEPILIMALVVIVTGGVGSVRGAFYGALVVGVIDTLGRSLLPLMLRGVLEQPLAHVVGPAIASIMIYLVMAMVLVVRPGGLFPVRHG